MAFSRFLKNFSEEFDCVEDEDALLHCYRYIEKMFVTTYELVNHNYKI